MTARPHRLLALPLAAALALGAAACGGDDSTDTGGSGAPGKGVKVTLADKGFTESKIVMNAYADALRAQGFDVTTKSLASTEIAYAAVKKGSIDVYPEYDGTVFFNILKKSAAKGTTAATVEADVKAGLAKDGLATLPATPYNNGNQVACTKDAVAKHGIRNLTSLGKASTKLVYSANAEHLTRPDGLPLLRKAYGVRFKKVITVDISLRYTPIRDGKAQCVYAFGTDPQLAKLPLVLIQDDKGTFGGAVPFHSLPVINQKWLDGLKPDARAAFTAALTAVDKGLTQQKIQELNAAVDLDKEDPEDVAAEYVDGLEITVP